MKRLVSLLLAGILAAAGVSASELITGNFGRMMMGEGTGWVVAWLLNVALFVGLLLLVWLWVIKLWREVFGKKR